MTWVAKIMPDDQLDPASLVGGMLQVEQQQEITGDGSGEALPEMDGPLWEAMAVALAKAAGVVVCPAELVGTGAAGGMAEVMDALRDWLFLQTCHTTHALEVRDLLTEQARIARGEG
jgi:hypothetical protein